LRDTCRHCNNPINARNLSLFLALKLGSGQWRCFAQRGPIDLVGVPCPDKQHERRRLPSLNRNIALLNAAGQKTGTSKT